MRLNTAFIKIIGAEKLSAGVRKRGSSLIIVLGVLFVIFIFGFGYANYLRGQVYLLEREKDYEAARLIIKSGFTEALYMLNYDPAAFGQKMQSLSTAGAIRPYEFFGAKVEASKRLMKKVFEGYDNPSLKVWFELVSVHEFSSSAQLGEKFAKFKICGQLNAGLVVSKLEGEVSARLAKITYETRGGGTLVKLIPERIFAVVNREESLAAGKYYGICVYNGADLKKAKKMAEANEDFNALLVTPNGAIIVDKIIAAAGYSLTFGPLMLK